MRERLEALIRKLRRRVDYLDVRVERYERFSVSMTDGRAQHVGRSASVGGAVRAVRKGGYGFASFNDLAGLERFAEQAVEQARAVGRSTTKLAPVVPRDETFRTAVLDDPRSHSVAEKVELLERYSQVILGASPDLPSAQVSYFDEASTKTFASSEGTYLVQELTDCGLQAVPMARRGGATQLGVVSRGSTNDYRVVLGLEDALREECRLAVGLLDAPRVKAGVYDVVVDPTLAGVFVHEAFGHTSEADTCTQNPQLATVMKLGATFGSKVLNITDSGLDVGCRGFVKWDDEGVPAERTELIREGVLVGRLHSRETAAEMGERPTGNARAVSYRYSPICRMRNTRIEPGTARFEDMLEGVKLGLYAQGSHGGCGGEDFSFSALRGFMIRDGRLAEMVRDVKVAGNLWTTMKRIDRVGRDFSTESGPGGCGKGAQFPLPVSHSAPTIRIRGVSVGGEA